MTTQDTFATEMSAITDCYNQNINSLQVELKRTKTKGFILVVAKLVLVALMLMGAYQGVFNEWQPGLWGCGASIIAFVFVYRVDARFMEQRRLLAKLVIVNQNELAALAGNVSAFDQGQTFTDPQHDFTYDLDIFASGGLFQTINRTVTDEGRNALASMMKKTDVEPATVLNRQKAIAQLSPMLDWRLRFVAIGSLERLSLNNVVANFKQQHKIAINKWFKWVAIASVSITIVGLTGNIIGIWGTRPWLLPFFVNLMFVAYWLKQTNRIHGKLNGTFKTIEKYHHLLTHIHSANNQFNGELLETIVSTLTNGRENSIKAFDDLKKLLARFDQRSNILISVAVNGLFLSDLQLLWRYNGWIDRYGDLLNDYERAIAELDALVSLANFAYNNPSFSFPQLNDDKLIEADHLGHPLIDGSQRVCNDFSINTHHCFYITTGANMAGKSTFLRTVGVNLVLAASGAPVCAQRFVFKPIALFSSMRANDNLVSHVSYFQAELQRLQKLIDKAKTQQPMLVILDEILKGTNSKDKLEGSRLFLLKLLSYDVSGIIATHDLALGELSTEMPNNFANICFEVDITDDDLYFSYRLQQGVAKNMNATWLLNRMLNQ
jgi:predicted aspartyl protease